MSDTGSIRAQFLLFNFTFSDFTFCVGFVAKVGCVFTIAFGSLLPYSEFGQNDHLEDAPHFSLIGIRFSQDAHDLGQTKHTGQSQSSIVTVTERH